MTRTDPLNLSGTVVNGYQIAGYVGSGAAGIVYEATRDGKRFALKIYKEWLFEANAATQDARILREVSTRRVDHPNVCKVFEFDHALLHGVERRYLVMEFIEGRQLDDLIKSGMFDDWRVFAHFAGRLIDGVAALHAARSLHRDIKPPNVMIEFGTNRVVLTDFGVIADLEATTLLTTVMPSWEPSPTLHLSGC